MCQSVPEGYNRPKLEPHKYPVWLVVLASLAAVWLLVNLRFLPGDIDGARAIKKADRLYAAGDVYGALPKYKHVLEGHPTSGAAKIGAAECLFAQHNKAEDLVALETLKGVSLTLSEAEELGKVMPNKYWDLFDKEGKSGIKYQGR